MLKKDLIIPENVMMKFRPPLYGVKQLEVEVRVSPLHHKAIELVLSLLWLAPCPESISIYYADDCVSFNNVSSHKLLKGSTSNLVESNPSSKKPKALNWQEQKKLKRERKQIEEDKQTLQNLGSAIPQSNIGFKLLKQMGYTPGSALGKEGSGKAEPVAVEIRRGRAGIGKEDPEVEKARREKQNEERNKRKEEELMEDFGIRQKDRWKGRRIVVNFQKADAVLAQLENREVVEVEKKDEDTEEKEEDNEEEEITEEDLLNLLLKLRNEFHYCLFCGCQYETVEELESNCPGINEDDH